MGPQPRKSSITDCAGMIKYLPALPNTGNLVDVKPKWRGESVALHAQSILYNSSKITNNSNIKVRS